MIIDRQGNLLVVDDMVYFVVLSSLRYNIYFYDEFSHVHVLLKYSLRTLQLLFESGTYFVQHAWSCGYCVRAATNRERLLIE